MEKKFVYLVRYVDYDDGGVLGVWDSREKARKQLARIHKKYSGWVVPVRWKSDDVLVEVLDGEDLSGQYIIQQCQINKACEEA